MIFVLSIIAVFVGISIYLFFKAEGLQKELLFAKRDSSSTQKVNQALVDTLALVAQKNEEFVRFRYDNLKKNRENDEDLLLINPLIINYSTIFSECAKGKGKLKAITKKCLENYDANGYRDFSSYMKKREKHVQRMWASDTLNGFISLVEALLHEQSTKQLANNSAKKENNIATV